jgi:uncharacterized protein (TIGR02246 family)
MSLRTAARPLSATIAYLLVAAVANAQDSPRSAPPVAGAPAPRADLGAEERAIRQLTAQWLAAENRRDVDAVMRLFAEDAVAVYGGRLLTGRAAIRRDLVDALARPGLVQQWRTTEVRVSARGDMASQVGTYEATRGGVTSRGYSLTVYRKVDGGWRVVQDMLAPSPPRP